MNLTSLCNQHKHTNTNIYNKTLYSIISEICLNNIKKFPLVGKFFFTLLQVDFFFLRLT